jgi:hypothetical protein
LTVFLDEFTRKGGGKGAIRNNLGLRYFGIIVIVYGNGINSFHNDWKLILDIEYLQYFRSTNKDIGSNAEELLL